MKTKPCPIKACGARILEVDIDGKAVHLNPRKIETVFREENDQFRLVVGYQLHAYTCINLDVRPKAQRGN